MLSYVVTSAGAVVGCLGAWKKAGGTMKWGAAGVCLNGALHKVEAAGKDIGPWPAGLADLNGDGIVKAADLATLLGSWGPCPGCPADFDGDNMINAFDLATLLGAWGPCL